MTTVAKTIAIIGAGPSGLVSAKEAKQCGLEPTLFEKGDNIGGLWKPGSGYTWDSMQTNISHYSCTFSDFEWKKEVADFPNQSEIHQYLTQYADHFKISPHVRLNTEVTKVERQNSQWKVETKHDGNTKSQMFDYVIVCSGIFSKAFTPEIMGLETFKGSFIHSKDYKAPDSFKGKNVTVIGNEFSGSEIASQIATTADNVVNVIRSPVWILPRYLPKANTGEKLPLDLIFYSRAANERSKNISPKESNIGKSKWFNSICGNQTKICPDLEVTTPPENPSFITISDTYLPMIDQKKITIKKGSIEEINEYTLIFEDKSQIKTDAIVFCTGYRAALPFLDPLLLKKIEFDPNDPLQPILMHKTVFHPDLQNMAFIGMYRGPYFANMELQARWATMVFSGNIPYPTPEEMNHGIEVERKIRNTIPRPQFPHQNYVEFADDLAKEARVLPEFDVLKNVNHPLYEKLWNGPFTPASFRLFGLGNNITVATKILERINEAVETKK